MPAYAGPNNITSGGRKPFKLHAPQFLARKQRNTQLTVQEVEVCLSFEYEKDQPLAHARLFAAQNCISVFQHNHLIQRLSVATNEREAHCQSPNLCKPSARAKMTLPFAFRFFFSIRKRLKALKLPSLALPGATMGRQMSGT